MKYETKIKIGIALLSFILFIIMAFPDIVIFSYFFIQFMLCPPLLLWYLFVLIISLIISKLIYLTNTHILKHRGIE